MTKEQDMLFDHLLEYWQMTVDKFRDELARIYPMSSDRTASAIGAANQNPVTLNTNGFKVEVSMPDYYEYMDEGVSGAKNNKGISRFKYTNKLPPKKAILQFMDNRGISGKSKSNTTSGKRRDAESIRNGIAYAIAYKIWRDGQKPTNFYSNVINDKQLLDFEAKLLEQFSDYVVSIVRVD
tara:strand:+ start:919 stop:1461 length:543 start_codon:yes stop_codon:yes gene_type:complete